MFPITEGIKNGTAFFVEGKEKNFVLRETDYFKVGKRKNIGQNLNVKENCRRFMKRETLQRNFNVQLSQNM